jgi:hypothetical protein
MGWEFQEMTHGKSKKLSERLYRLLTIGMLLCLILLATGGFIGA